MATLTCEGLAESGQLSDRSLARSCPHKRFKIKAAAYLRRSPPSSLSLI